MKQTKFYNTNKSRQIELTVSQYGWEKCESLYSFGPYVRDFNMIHFVVAGKGKFHYKNKIFEIGENQGFFIMSKEEAFYQADETDPWEYYWIGFKGVDALKYIKKAGLNSGGKYSFTLSRDNTAKCIEILQKMLECNADDVAGEVFVLGYLYQFLAVLIENNSIFVSKNRAEEVALQMIEFLEEDLLGYTITGIARKLNLDRTSLYRLFKSHFNMSPQEYILNYKLEKAVRLISEKKYSLGEISCLSGFNNYCYFSKIFKARFEKSPKEYSNSLYSAQSRNNEMN